MPPTLNSGNYNVSAVCPNCKTVTSFEQRHSIGGPASPKEMEQGFVRVLYVAGQCASCLHGSLATVLDKGARNGASLKSFSPREVDRLTIPDAVPTEISAEFREAEECQSVGAKRAASALFRSVLEKALKVNGYTRTNDPTLKDLQKRIDAAAADGVITESRRKKAHDDIRSLGNDVLHDDWREVEDEEVENSHKYMQRVLEDLYDDRPTVETILISKGRLKSPPAPSATLAATVATPATVK
jgi:hypothetical protein